MCTSGMSVVIKLINKKKKKCQFNVTYLFFFSFFLTFNLKYYVTITQDLLRPPVSLGPWLRTTDLEEHSAIGFILIG